MANNTDGGTKVVMVAPSRRPPPPTGPPTASMTFGAHPNLGLQSDNSMPHHYQKPQRFPATEPFEDVVSIGSPTKRQAPQEIILQHQDVVKSEDIVWSPTSSSDSGGDSSLSSSRSSRLQQRMVDQRQQQQPPQHYRPQQQVSSSLGALPASAGPVAPEQGAVRHSWQAPQVPTRTGDLHEPQRYPQHNQQKQQQQQQAVSQQIQGGHQQQHNPYERQHHLQRHPNPQYQQQQQQQQQHYYPQEQLYAQQQRQEGKEGDKNERHHQQQQQQQQQQARHFPPGPHPHPHHDYFRRQQEGHHRHQWQQQQQHLHYQRQQQQQQQHPAKSKGGTFVDDDFVEEFSDSNGCQKAPASGAGADAQKRHPVHPLTLSQKQQQQQQDQLAKEMPQQRNADSSNSSNNNPKSNSNPKSSAPVLGGNAGYGVNKENAQQTNGCGPMLLRELPVKHFEKQGPAAAVASAATTGGSGGGGGVGSTQAQNALGPAGPLKGGRASGVDVVQTHRNGPQSSQSSGQLTLVGDAAELAFKLRSEKAARRRQRKALKETASDSKSGGRGRKGRRGSKGSQNGEKEGGEEDEDEDDEDADLEEEWLDFHNDIANNGRSGSGSEKFSSALSSLSPSMLLVPRLQPGFTRCVVTREKGRKGLTGRLTHPTCFHLYLQSGLSPGSPPLLVLLAQKHTGSRTTNYRFFDMTMGNQSQQNNRGLGGGLFASKVNRKSKTAFFNSGKKLSKKAANYVGKMRGNFNRDEYTLFAEGAGVQGCAGVRGGNSGNALVNGNGVGNGVDDNEDDEEEEEDNDGSGGGNDSGSSGGNRLKVMLGSVVFDKIDLVTQMREGAQPRKMGVLVPTAASTTTTTSNSSGGGTPDALTTTKKEEEEKEEGKEEEKDRGGLTPEERMAAMVESRYKVKSLDLDDIANSSAADAGGGSGGGGGGGKKHVSEGAADNKHNTKKTTNKASRPPQAQTQTSWAQLSSKDPVYEKGNYRLNFSGRVKMPSVKNYQLVPPHDPDDVWTQFGKVNEHDFHLDFKKPLSPLFAFAIAISQFDY